MESISNFRELGNIVGAAGPVRAGVLFRSGHLGDLSDADAAALGDLGLRTIIDLRTAEDIAGEGADRVPDGVDHHHLPIFDDAGAGDTLRALIMRLDVDELRRELGGGRGRRIALEGAEGFVTNPERVATFAQTMAFVTRPDNWPLLWHCSAGKDRAGWVATAVLLAAGAPDDVIVEHYLESNRARGTISLFEEGEIKDLVRPFLEVHEDYVRAQLDAVERVWGGVDGLYRDGFGISAADLDAFRVALRSG